MIADSAARPREGGDGGEPVGDVAREELTVRQGTRAGPDGQDDRKPVSQMLVGEKVSRPPAIDGRTASQFTVGVEKAIGIPISPATGTPFKVTVTDFPSMRTSMVLS